MDKAEQHEAARLAAEKRAAENAMCAAEAAAGDADALAAAQKAEQPCRAFLKTGACRYGASCRFTHSGSDSVVSFSWQVSGLPPSVCEPALEEAFRSSLSVSTGQCSIDLRNRAGNALKPYAFLCFQPEAQHETFDDGLLLQHGLIVNGLTCQLKRRKQSREARKVAQAAADRAPSDRSDAKRIKQLSDPPTWSFEMLNKFPQRHSCLCKHAMIAQLPPDLLSLVVEVYLPSRMPGQRGQEMRTALQWIWEQYPTSVRLKELFETVESFVSISKQVRVWLERAEGASTIFDLACGHGLLGVMLASQFPDLQVVCVDLIKRDGFEIYRQAFHHASLQTLGNAKIENSITGYYRQHQGSTGKQGGFVSVVYHTDAEPSLLQTNLQFHEGDMVQVAVPANSFVCCVHACNEANKIAVDMAVESGAGFAAMPCCIRNGLYCTKALGQDDDSRYTLMVGVMAGVYSAHTINSIHRGITNRHFIMYGGY